MRVILLTLATLLSVAYPFVVFWGEHLVEPTWLIVAIAAVTLLRGILVDKQGDIKVSWVLLLCAICVYAVWTIFSDSERAILYYPLLANLAVLCLFGYTLVKPPSLIERLARARGMVVSSQGTGYLKVVTALWCLLFSINVLAAFITATYTSAYTWWLYNGVIAYVLMALLFFGECAYRPFYKRRVHQHNA